MLLIVLLVVLALAFTVVGLCVRKHDEYSAWEAYFVVAAIILAVAIIIGCIAWHEYAFRDAAFEAQLLKYNSLVTQLEGDYYNKITYDGRKALMDDIINYNITVVRCRAKHHSRWIGALYPEDWDALPLIEF